ncbi:MAG: hypothetical protein J6U23_15115 [Clostridiales bacterium]|nr:hypothetical protein [Clostridiales bacterium]
MKKNLSLIMALVMAGSICACNNDTGDKKEVTDKETTSTTTEETTVGESESTTSASQVVKDIGPSETDPQIDLIASLKDTWFTPSDDHATFYYCVTDFDHNGRLEINCASMQGSGYFTSARFFEVNEACDGLTECSLPNDDFEGFLFPDIITDEPIEVYTDGNTYTYIFDDTVVTNSDESSLYTNTFSINNTYINIFVIAEKTSRSDGSIFYSDFSRVLDESEYQSILDNPVPGQTKSTCYLGWIPTSNTEDLNALLKGSYQTFLG